MDLEVVGRHALLFDDDTNASFVNSTAALVDWNSLSIDRYDVRHLLSSPPPRVKRRHLSPPRHPDSPPESELDYERYLDLPSTSPEEEQDLESGTGPVNDGGFNAVPFSYGNTAEPSDERNADTESGFQPPFPLPESLLQNLPPTEKVHQIIARTAIFVSKHGGQSEIVLRVKQGDNPTFGFLMPDHHLHSYFRFLVDHPELLGDENKTDGGIDQTSGDGGGGALSLLGSVYGYGEDEDGAPEDTLEPKRNESGEAFDAINVTVSNISERTESSVNLAGKDEKVSKHSLPSSKEKAPWIKRNQSIGTVKARTSSGMKKEGDLGLACPASDKSQAFASPSMSKVKLPVVDPPSDMKRVVDKIVEFICKNGKEFEAVLVEQDHKHGRFPFLLPTNVYHPYYLEVLHKAEESTLPGKVSTSEKHESTGLGVDKKNSTSKESDALSWGSDIPYDSDRKEKFKMVIGKSKKDGQDQPSKATQPNVGVTVDAAAAILQAATRGIRKPNLEILTKMSLNGTSEGLSGDGGQRLSLSSLSSRPESSKQKLDHQVDPSVSVTVANAIAKSAAIDAASEADSSEASLTIEQKLKAERLKRAKVFAAMIKNKAAPLKPEQLRCLSAEPPESGFSQPASEDLNLVGKEREGSSVKLDVDIYDKNEKSEKKDFADDNERRSKRKYRSRSKRNEDDEDEDEGIEEKDHKRSEKKRQSRRSSHHSRDRKRHSSSKDRDSLHRHRHDSSSDHEHRHSRRHKHGSTSDSEYPKSRDMKKLDSSSHDELGHSRRRRKHDTSSDGEHHHSRHQNTHDNSSNDEHGRYQRRRKHSGLSDDEHRQRRKSQKRKKGFNADREVDLEEGEIKSDQSKASESNAASREPSVDMSKSYQASREGSVDLSKSHNVGRASTLSTTSAQVSDDLRAKIRAMLMATL